MDGPGARRPAVRAAFIAATLFFTVSPLLSMVSHPVAVPALLLLLAAWAIFAVVLVLMLRQSPFDDPTSPRTLAIASAAITVLATVAIAGWGGAAEGAATFFYAGVTAARVRPERLSLALIAFASVAAAIAIPAGGGDVDTGITIAVTVGTISLTLFALSAMGRTNRELRAAREELAVLAVGEERSRIARDLHDTIGHSLSVIALKSELARRVLPTEPDRAAAEIADVEQVARDALAAVRETVEGYRTPSLALELAAARSALATAGIAGTVEPAPDGLPPAVDAVLGWAVREGVTNVLRHSDAATARIRVQAGDGAGTVEITDDGRGSTPPEPGSRAGSGIAGLRERAAAVGGRVDAGPLPGGGFSLRVSVPVSGAGAA